jgi:hypothetical protein
MCNKSKRVCVCVCVCVCEFWEKGRTFFALCGCPYVGVVTLIRCVCMCICAIKSIFLSWVMVNKISKPWKDKYLEDKYLIESSL